MLAFDSKIITFYSYKGGVGRSMALANVAWLLAKRYQQKVLVVDWDLEAPGIHKYFDIKDCIQQGLIDILYKFQDLAESEECTFEGQFLDIRKYIIDIEEDFGKGSLSILPAGRTSNKYGNQVAQFDWNDFYERLHGFGFIEYLKEQLKQKADFILIDSRTGLSDIGGICTLQLPDAVVMMFALNEQSIFGTEMIIESILNKSKEVKRNKSSPQLIIIPSRVEKFMEIENKKTWEITAAERLYKYISNKFLLNGDDFGSPSSILESNALPESINLSFSSGKNNIRNFEKEFYSKYQKKGVMYGWERTSKRSKGRNTPGLKSNDKLIDVSSRPYIDYIREKSIPYVGYYSFGEKLSVKEDISEEPNKSFYKLTEMILVTCHYEFNEELEYSQNHRQTLDENKDVRGNAAKALGTAFQDMPNKQHAWEDLHRLTNDLESSVRKSTSKAICSAFPHLPDKQQAWNDLYKLTNDEDKYVRQIATSSLASAFFHMPDKQQAWNDLYKLSNVEDNWVRAYANHHLGKICIFKASQAEKEEDYKIELEKAIEFFEKASQEPKCCGQSQFCFPFYRSLYTIIFEKQDAKEEVDKYIAEAKAAVGSSNENKLLLEAVENLANALFEAQNLENLDLEAMKDELNFYRKYCDRAAELMRDTEETAPFATATLRRGFRLLDRKLKNLLEEIQERAKTICQESQGTPTQEIAHAVIKEVKKWEIGSQEEMKQKVEDIAYILKKKIGETPENEFVLNKIDAMRHERDLTKQYETLSFIIGLIPTLSIVSEKELEFKLSKLDSIYDKTLNILPKLDLVSKELIQGFEKMDLLSQEVGGQEGELIKSFSKRVRELTEKSDKESLGNFLEEINKKENTLIEEIEKSSAPPEEKEESKRSILNIRSVIDKVKHPIKSFGKDVTNEIIVTYTAEEILKLVFQLVSMATFRVPTPPQILDLMSNMTKELKK